MKRVLAPLASAFVLLIGLPPSLISAGEDQGSKPVGVATPASPSVVLGQPILVDVTVDNRSPSAWIVDWGGFQSNNVTLTIADPEMPGLDPAKELTRRPDSLDATDQKTLGGPVVLESGGQLRQTLVLNSWFDFDQAGSYDVVMKVPIGPEQTGVNDALEIEFKVEVRGPDSEALAEACSALAETALHGSMGSGLRAGEALSYVRDAVCVPALARVLSEHSYVKNEVVTALAEMGTEEAVSVLVGEWGHLTAGVRARAKYEFWIRGRANQLEAALAEEGLSVTDDRDDVLLIERDCRIE